MKPFDPKDLEKILNDQAGEDELRSFDALFTEDELEEPSVQFTSRVVGSYQDYLLKRKALKRRILFLSLGLVIFLVTVFLTFKGGYYFPTLGEWTPYIPDVSTNTDLVRKTIILINGIMLLFVLDRAILRPWFSNNY